VWPRQPDIGTVKSLASHHLVTELPVPYDSALLEVSFFAEGGFNKLYKISYPGHQTSYLLRAAIPIEPYYKTESEVATIAYLRANTSVPVPRVLVWDSNRDNELSFEWILMEMMYGVSLYDVWREVPWEHKVELTKTIAGMVKQLRDQKFDRIGGLYFQSAVAHQTKIPEKVAKPKALVERRTVDELVNRQLMKPVDEPADEPVDEPMDRQLMKPVDEPVGKFVDEQGDEQMVEMSVETRLGEPVDEHANEVVTKIVEALVDEVVNDPIDDSLHAGIAAGIDSGNDVADLEAGIIVMPSILLVNEPVDESLDAGMDVEYIKASNIAIPLALQDLHLDARSTTDTQCPATGSTCTVNNDPNEVKHLLTCDSDGPDGSREAGATGTIAIAPFGRGEQQIPTRSAGQGDFTVGRMFDSLFYIGNRPNLPANRGPYRSSLEWLSALVRVQLEWVKNGPIEGDEEYGEDMEEEFPKIERLCRGFLDILPTVCSDEEGPGSFCLHHSDLNTANILVHPDTFEITGIVDWEFINVVPKWRAFEHPHFLINIEPMSETEPPIPIYEDNEEDFEVYARDRWDERILRRQFDQTIDLLTQGDEISTNDAMKMKVQRDCREVIPALSDVWNWSRLWLKTYKTTGVSKNHVDCSKESSVFGEKGSDSEDYTWLDTTKS